MQRIEQVDPESATGKTAELLSAVNSQMGIIPNILKTMAQSPATLGGYLGLSSGLNGGVLSAQLREQIALVVAGTNGCDYCASVHTAVGSQTGLSAQELASNLRGKSADTKTAAALAFAKAIVTKKGFVCDGAMAEIRHAGFSEEEIVEIVGNTVMNIFTNYFNHIAGTEIDFPVVNTREAVAS